MAGLEQQAGGSKFQSFNVYAKLFSEPIRNVGPRGSITQACAHVRTRWGEYTFRPHQWADTLSLTGVYTNVGEVAKDNHRVNQTAHLVVVDSSLMERLLPKPGFSKKGAHWLNLLSRNTREFYTELDSEGPDPDLVTGLRLMTCSEIEMLTFQHDEAPLLRALLLHMCMMDADWHVKNSVLAHTVQFGGGRPINIVKKWQQINRRGELNGTLQIPLHTGTSTIWVIPIDVYTNILNSSCIYTDIYRGVNVRDCVIIPLEVEQLDQDWIVPYIMCHTTTLWWNHAVWTEFEVDDKRYSDKGQKLKVTAHIQASKVVIEGGYTNILIVLTNATAESFSSNRIKVRGFTTPTIPLGSEGYNDFAKVAFTWLGRYDRSANDNTVVGTKEQSASCIANMQRSLCFRGVMERCLSMAAELCTTLPLGYAVSTDPNTVPESFQGGPRCFNIDRSATVNKIGKNEVADWHLDWDDIGDALMGMDDWRVSPAGRFLEASVDTINEKATDNDRQGTRWCLYNIDKWSNSYAVKETSPISRILRAMGVFEGLREVGPFGFSTANDIANYIIGLGSLQAGVMGWMMCESGCNIMDTNGFVSLSPRPFEDHFLMSFMRNSTIQFFQYSPLPKKKKSDEFLNRVKAFLGITDVTKWSLDNWYSIHVPGWFVLSVAEKFGAVIANKKDGIDWYYSDEEDIEAFVCDEASSWSESVVLTSSLKYEMGEGRQLHRFAILLPDRVGSCSSPGITGWMNYAFIDHMKAEHAQNVSEGVIQTLAVPHPFSRSVRGQRGPFGIVVESDCSFPRTKNRSLMERELKLPYNFCDWLKKNGLLKATASTHGDVASAVPPTTSALVNSVNRTGTFVASRTAY